MTATGCEPYREWIVPMLDGELPEADARALRAHVGRCPACGDALAREQALWRLLGEEPGLEADLLPRVRTALGVARIRRARLWRPVAVAASVLLAALWFALAGWHAPPAADVIADLDVLQELEPLQPEALEILRDLDLEDIDLIYQVEIPSSETDPWEFENI